LGRTLVVLSDLLHQQMNEIISFSCEHPHVDISICALAFQLVHGMADTCENPLHPARSLSFGGPYLTSHAYFSKSWLVSKGQVTRIQTLFLSNQDCSIWHCSSHVYPVNTFGACCPVSSIGSGGEGETSPYPIDQNTYFHRISKESFLQRFHIPIIH
jgi:hypothetical protein